MKMIVPVIAEGRQIDMELLAEFLEELYGVVTVQSDVLCKAEESRTLLLSVPVSFAMKAMMSCSSSVIHFYRTLARIAIEWRRRAMPTIFHLDMDAFFVSVEELFDPSLKGRPVVVGGQAHERGVVSAASYEARKFGVHSALPLRTAYQLCPQAIFLDGHPTRYREYSEKVFEVLNSFSP